MKGKRVLLFLIVILILISGCMTSREADGKDLQATSTETDTHDGATAEPHETKGDSSSGASPESHERETDEGISKPQTETETKETSFDVRPYASILDQFYEMIAHHHQGHEISIGELGVMDAIKDLKSEEALAKIGFTMEDISGDQIPELIIAPIESKVEDTSLPHEIYTVYTLVDGKPYLSLEGWSQNIYRYMGDGHLFYQGSAGATNTIFAIYHFSSDAKEILTKDYYFSFVKEDGNGELEFYYNKSGEFDPTVSEKLDINEEEFRKLQEISFRKSPQIKLMPFANYKPSGVAFSEVGVSWAEDALAQYKEYDEFVADHSEHQVKLLFSTKEAVKDFKFLKLSIDAIDHGKLKFSKEELTKLESLAPERPLVVTMTFFGDTPSYGFSYEDSKGNTKHFSLSLSGKDGSIVMTEFQE